MASRKSSAKSLKDEYKEKYMAQQGQGGTRHDANSGAGTLSCQIKDAEVDVELAELIKDMTLMGSKPGYNVADAGETGDICGSPLSPYIPRSVLYYGWFFGENVSSSLKNYAEACLQNCISENSNFSRFITDTCQGQDIMDYFRKPNSKSDIHVTAKFCGRTSHQQYEDLASAHLGKVFELSIVGIFITKSTLGYRVALNETQLELFDDERKNELRKTAASSPSTSSSSPSPRNSPNHAKQDKLKQKKTSKHVPTKQQRKNSNESTTSHQSTPDFPGLTFVEQRTIGHEPILTNTRAHITIGCAPRVKPFRAGEDLLDIIGLESQTTGTRTYAEVFSKTLPVPNIFPEDGTSILRQFGRQHGDAYMIYFSHAVVAKAVFMAYA